MKIVVKFLLGTFLLATASVFSQQPLSMTYEDLSDPKPVNLAPWKNLNSGTYISFASVDDRYGKMEVPELAKNETVWQTKAWKGEKVHTQFLIWTTKELKNVQLECSDLVSEQKNSISKNRINSNFVRYVMTDALNAKGSGCNIKDVTDSSLVEDLISKQKVILIKGNTTQPVWLSVAVPESSRAGLYKGVLKVKDGNEVVGQLDFSIQVQNRLLPSAKDWKFHLDLWQSPYAVARVHGVKLWSKEHMEAMRPYMEMLAAAGQKTITATIINDPWNSQTQDVYGSMVKWVRKKDGSWSYDYTVFDQWVNYMMSFGIDKLINCYSMIPWNLKFYYFDQAKNSEEVLTAAPGSAEYEAHWHRMLTDFAKHLKQKGWFNKTTIAMDERPMDAMKKAIAVIKGVDKDFKISLAGDYHGEIEKDLFDYCVAIQQPIPAQTIKDRQKAGLITTFYTCCIEAYPNTFTFSPLAQSAWMGWFAASKGFDGYLRWAYNCWPTNPFQDSRFGNWSAGDTYLVYPGAQSSIRFERLIEGLQDFEKIRVLKKEFEARQQSEQLKELETILSRFEIEKLKDPKAAAMILNEAKVFLNK